MHRAAGPYQLRNLLFLVMTTSLNAAKIIKNSDGNDNKGSFTLANFTAAKTETHETAAKAV
jgi:hypothetical protein